MTQPVTELGQLIDCTEEEFNEYCTNKDIGYLSSFHNLMVQTYNQVSDLNKELVAKAAKEPKPISEEMKTALEGMHSKLLRIEQRVFMLKGFIRSRHLH